MAAIRQYSDCRILFTPRKNPMPTPKNTRQQKPKRPPVDDSDDELESEGKQSLLHDGAYTADDVSPALQAFYVQHGIDPEKGAATVNVSLIENAKDVNVWRGEFSDYDLHEIAKQFGSGDYRVRIYVQDGASLGAPLRGNVVISYRLSPADERKRRVKLAEIEAPVVIASGNQNADVLSAIREMMAGFQNSMMQMMTAQNKASDPMQTLEGVRAIAEMFKPAAAPAPRGFMDSMREMKEFIEVSKALAPAAPLIGEDGKVSGEGVLMKALDVFGGAMAQAKAQPTALPEVSGTPDAYGNGGADENLEVEAEQMKFLMKMQLRTGLQLAKAGADCEEYADGIYELLPDASITTLCSDADWFTRLCEIEPQCANHPEFFRKVHGLIVQWAIVDGLTTPPIDASVPPNVTPATTQPIESHPATGAGVNARANT